MGTFPRNWHPPRLKMRPPLEPRDPRRLIRTPTAPPVEAAHPGYVPPPGTAHILPNHPIPPASASSDPTADSPAPPMVPVSAALPPAQPNQPPRAPPTQPPRAQIQPPRASHNPPPRAQVDPPPRLVPLVNFNFASLRGFTGHIAPRPIRAAAPTPSVRNPLQPTIQMPRPRPGIPPPVPVNARPAGIPTQLQPRPRPLSMPPKRGRGRSRQRRNRFSPPQTSSPGRHAFQSVPPLSPALASLAGNGSGAQRRPGPEVRIQSVTTWTPARQAPQRETAHHVVPHPTHPAVPPPEGRASEPTPSQSLAQSFSVIDGPAAASQELQRLYRYGTWLFNEHTTVSAAMERIRAQYAGLAANPELPALSVQPPTSMQGTYYAPAPPALPPAPMMPPAFPPMSAHPGQPYWTQNWTGQYYAPQNVVPAVQRQHPAASAAYTATQHEPVPGPSTAPVQLPVVLPQHPVPDDAPMPPQTDGSADTTRPPSHGPAAKKSRRPSSALHTPVNSPTLDMENAPPPSPPSRSPISLASDTDDTDTVTVSDDEDDGYGDSPDPIFPAMEEAVMMPLQRTGSPPKSDRSLTPPPSPRPGPSGVQAPISEPQEDRDEEDTEVPKSSRPPPPEERPMDDHPLDLSTDQLTTTQQARLAFHAAMRSLQLANFGSQIYFSVTQSSSPATVPLSMIPQRPSEPRLVITPVITATSDSNDNSVTSTPATATTPMTTSPTSITTVATTSSAPATTTTPTPTSASTSTTPAPSTTARPTSTSTRSSASSRPPPATRASRKRK